MRRLTIPNIVLTIVLVWCLASTGIFLVYYGVQLLQGGTKLMLGHRQFAANSTSHIQPSREMDLLFPDCRHYITYGPNDVPLLNSEAYFGDRYVLSMQVAVAIQSPNSGQMIADPEFLLLEVSSVSVSPTGQVGASFSRNLKFTASEWRQVYSSSGDFGLLAFPLNPTPVPSFPLYAASCRPSD